LDLHEIYYQSYYVNFKNIIKIFVYACQAKTAAQALLRGSPIRHCIIP
jgi:hypothetical protein